MGGWLHFNRGDRRAFPVLVLLLAAVGALVYGLLRRPAVNDVPVSGRERAEIDRFVQQQPSAPPRAARPAAGPAPRLFRFNPNTADSATFVRLGLKPWQARAAVHYRQAGGRFREKDDFARLYGLDRQQFLRLRPYIDLPEQVAETLPPQRPLGAGRGSFKLQEGQTIELSTADTAQLRRIPDIGPYWARRIADYGRRLGGYVSLAQLGEIEGLPAGTQRYLTLSPAPPRRLDLNRADFHQLLAHPYLNYNQVRAIVNRRRRFGAFRSLSQLLTDSAFTHADVERLSPYVTLGRP